MADSYKEFLLKHAKERDIKVPTKRTLTIYGLTDRDWLSLFHKQDWKCGVCGTEKAHWNTDHQHVPGFKRMAPRTRATFVRGILCWKCNKSNAPSNISGKHAQALADYIREYEHRRGAGS